MNMQTFGDEQQSVYNDGEREGSQRQREGVRSRHYSRKFRVIGIMFWAFPYLLWQAFGHISGFFVGVALAVILTWMLYGLFRQESDIAPYARPQPLRAVEWAPKEQREEAKLYQRGYRGSMEVDHGEQQSYQAKKLQPQYEEMQVLYPQEIPPLRSRQEVG